MPTRQRQFAPLSLSSTADVARFCKLFSSLSPVRRLHNSLLSTTKKKSASLLRLRARFTRGDGLPLSSFRARSYSLKTREACTQNNDTRERDTQFFAENVGFFSFVCFFFFAKKNCFDADASVSTRQKSRKKDKKILLSYGERISRGQEPRDPKKTTKNSWFFASVRNFFFTYPPHQLQLFLLRIQLRHSIPHTMATFSAAKVRISRDSSFIALVRASRRRFLLAFTSSYFSPSS